MANHQHEITRFAFPEEALENEELLKRFPGFFSNGPERFGEHLLDGETYFNVVDTFIPFFNTKDGIRIFTGVRHNHNPISHEPVRQGNLSSAITMRRTHARAQDLMNAYNQFRVPILGGSVEEEGYHFKPNELDPRNPVLVADYEPGAKLEGDADDMLFSDFVGLMDKTQWYESYSAIDSLYKDAEVWPGPTLVGISEVGTYFDESRQTHPDIPLIMTPIPRKEDIPAGGRPVMEAHIFTSKIVTVDCPHLTDREVLRHFPYSNEHYYHFDLAPIEQFNYAVKEGVVDLVSPRFREDPIDSMKYMMACARGMCLRTAAAGLSRHIAYIKKKFGYDKPVSTFEPIYEDGLYRPPMKLTLSASRTIIDLSNRSSPRA